MSDFLLNLARRAGGLAPTVPLQPADGATPVPPHVDSAGDGGTGLGSFASEPFVSVVQRALAPSTPVPPPTLVSSPTAPAPPARSARSVASAPPAPVVLSSAPLPAASTSAPQITEVAAREPMMIERSPGLRANVRPPLPGVAAAPASAPDSLVMTTPPEFSLPFRVVPSPVAAPPVAPGPSSPATLEHRSETRDLPLREPPTARERERRAAHAPLSVPREPRRLAPPAAGLRDAAGVETRSDATLRPAGRAVPVAAMPLTVPVADIVPVVAPKTPTVATIDPSPSVAVAPAPAAGPPRPQQQEAAWSPATPAAAVTIAPVFRHSPMMLAQARPGPQDTESQGGVHVHIGSVEIRAEVALPPAAPRATDMPPTPTVAGFEEFAALRSYAAWNE